MNETGIKTTEESDTREQPLSVSIDGTAEPATTRSGDIMFFPVSENKLYLLLLS